MIKIERDNRKIEISNGSLALILLITLVAVAGITTIVSFLNDRLEPVNWMVILIVLFSCLTLFAIFSHMFRLFKDKMEYGDHFAKSIKDIRQDISKIKKILEQTED